MLGRGRAPCGCARHGGWSRGVGGGRTVEMEAVRVEAVVGVGSGGSHARWSHRHGGWRQGSVEDGGAAAAMEKRAATVDPEKGAVAVVEEVGGRTLTPDVLASGILASSLVSCTRSVR
jgi:hypothetical protein